MSPTSTSFSLVSAPAKLRRLGLLTVASGALLLGACANQAVTQSGFLNDYAKLQATPGDGKGLSYSQAASGLMPSNRQLVVIDPVQLRLPAEQAAELAPDLVRQAQADYRVALEKAFSKTHQVVAEVPASGALLVRAAITGLKPSNPTLNTLTFLLVGPVSNGGVSTEAEVVDSNSGERVAARATFTNGNLFNGGMGGFFDKLGHVRKAFDSHAEQLRELTTTKQPAQMAAR